MNFEKAFMAAAVGASVAVILGVGATVALAADLGSMKDSPSYDVAPTQGVSWTGFYVGAELGYGAGVADTSEHSYFPLSGHIYDHSTKGFAATGWNGDVTLGYDWHIGGSRWLIGAFGDYRFGKLSGSKSDSDNLPTKDTNPGTLEYSIGDQFNVGGRLGAIVTPGTLAYVKAGYSQADIKATGTGRYAPEGDGAWKTSTGNGWLLGVGFESSLGANFFLRGEYDYTRFGKVTAYDYSLPVTNDLGKAAGNYTHDIKADVDEHLVKVGLIYKLGIGK
jgi:outer membrane immunogenic protein